jgi:uncharacterized protein
MSAGSLDPGLNGVVPFRWACHRCARCCSGGSGHVWVEPDEIEPMAAALSMQASAFVERYTREVTDPQSGARRLSLREEGRGEGGRCALLVGAAECSVYAARPAHCRRFPYWDAVLADSAAFEAARATCPGIAVVVPDELRERAFAELRALYASLPSPSVPSPCCAERRPYDLYATGLEADFAATCAPGADCTFGEGRPLACRVPQADEQVAREALDRLRALERRLGYPAAYGRLIELLRAREAGMRHDARS